MDHVLAQAARRQSAPSVCLSRALTPKSQTATATPLTLLQTMSSAKNVQETGSRKLQLMFYVPPDDDFLVNRLVAWATAEKTYTHRGNSELQRFAHVELSFDDDPNGSGKLDPHRTLAFSIVQNSTVFFQFKSWRESYVAVTLMVSHEQYAWLFTRCLELSQQKIAFDSFGMYASHFAPSAVLTRRTREEHGTFCSRIITEVLQEAGIGGKAVEALVPAATTPCKLFVSVRPQVSDVCSAHRKLVQGKKASKASVLF